MHINICFPQSCRKGSADIVHQLLTAGAQVDTTGMYSWTPLLVAVRGNFPSVVALLLEEKPNVNAVDQEGLTALALACKEGRIDIAYQLISAGAFLNIQDRGGDTNLILACKGGHKAIVEALLKKYADVNTRVGSWDLGGDLYFQRHLQLKHCREMITRPVSTGL